MTFAVIYSFTWVSKCHNITFGTLNMFLCILTQMRQCNKKWRKFTFHFTEKVAADFTKDALLKVSLPKCLPAVFHTDIDLPLLTSGCSSCTGRRGTVWPTLCCCLVWMSRCVCWPRCAARRGCWWCKPELTHGMRCSGATEQKRGDE